jgi:hypothetical protein
MGEGDDKDIAVLKCVEKSVGKSAQQAPAFASSSRACGRKR